MIKRKSLVALILISILLGFIIGITGFSNFHIISTEEKIFLKAINDNFKTELAIKEIVPGFWDEVCIFIAKDSYPESAMNGLRDHLSATGFLTDDIKGSSFPVVLFLRSKTAYKIIRLPTNKIRHDGITHYFFAAGPSMQEKHKGCVAFDKAAFKVVKVNSQTEYQLGQRGR